MNKVVEIGRLTKDPDLKTVQNEKGDMKIAKYILAVERRFKREGEADADFLPCTCFGKQAEFAEKYLHKGMKIAVTGRIQTGNYTNKDGARVYTTDIIVEEHEFVEKKNNGGVPDNSGPEDAGSDGFMSVPDEDLPF